MSIRNAIAQCRKPFASGRDRCAYYSRRYNVVIKMEKRLHNAGQSRAEARMFMEMTDEEKKIFPIVDVVDYKGRICIIMKRCNSLRSYKTPYFSPIDSVYQLDDLCDEYNYNPVNNKAIIKMMQKYNIHDIHFDNIGLDENNALVLLDCGL